jgi:hypothetical protein
MPASAGYPVRRPDDPGFSHTHFSGAGHSDLGDILLTPVSGEAKLEPGDSDKPGSGYRSRYSHDTEVAQPGYYAVTLSDSQVRAELTAGLRTACIATPSQPGDRAQVLIDLRSSIYNYPGKVLWSRIRVAPTARSPAIARRAAGRPAASSSSPSASTGRWSVRRFHNREAEGPVQGLRPAGPHAE